MAKIVVVGCGFVGSTVAYSILQRGLARELILVDTDALRRDQRSVWPVSVPLSGQYGLEGLSLSLPCVLGRGGALRVLEPSLPDGDRRSLEASAAVLRAALASAA